MTNKVPPAEIEELLSELDTNNLLALCNTISQGLLKNRLGSREEALGALLTYSNDPLGILKRKVITREILFAYLHKKNITVTLPASKNDLIDKVVQVWENLDINKPTEATKSCEINTVQNSDEIELLAMQFSQWFYSILNTYEPIGEHHFYPDAKLKIYMMVNEETDVISVENNANEVVQQLFCTKMRHSLYFNPNLSKDGVRGRIDSYGLVIVRACGTLHVNETCVGVFEQFFHLVRDPLADNNWKIKNTELKLRSQSVSEVPRLCS